MCLSEFMQRFYLTYTDFSHWLFLAQEANISSSHSGKKGSVISNSSASWISLRIALNLGASPQGPKSEGLDWKDVLETGFTALGKKKKKTATATAD